jgi:uncharacterized protein (DUF433 family)
MMEASNRNFGRDRAMQLEDYFNFLADNDIRLKGTRVGIETILYEYLFKSRTPEEIQQIYHSLTLEQVYATILYYHHKKEAVHQYMADWLDFAHQQRKAQALNPPPAAARLRKIRLEREAGQGLQNAEISY